MEKYKIIALFGPSGAGKDTIQKAIVSNYSNMNKIISCTTRPKRDYEVDGVDYFFLTPLEFAQKVLDGSMLEATSFRAWMYGTPLDGLAKDKINIGVFNITGIECMLEDSRLEVIPVYVSVSAKERMIRALEREIDPDCHEICRRFLSDEKDFARLESGLFDYYEITNEDGITLEALNEWALMFSECFAE